MAVLTPRMREALTLAACGYTEIETAQRLHLSEHTVRWYWREARRRLKAVNTTQAVALGWLLGLINLNTFIAEMAIQGCPVTDDNACHGGDDDVGHHNEPGADGGKPL